MLLCRNTYIATFESIYLLISLLKLSLRETLGLRVSLRKHLGRRLFFQKKLGSSLSDCLLRHVLPLLDEAARSVSTGKLNTLLYLHTQPIKQLVLL